MNEVIQDLVFGSHSVLVVLCQQASPVNVINEGNTVIDFLWYFQLRFSFGRM
jgi:hypothetical protein